MYSITVVFVILIGLWALYEREKADVVGKFGLALESIAATVAPHINGDQLDELISNKESAPRASRECVQSSIESNMIIAFVRIKSTSLDPKKVGCMNLL